MKVKKHAAATVPRGSSGVQGKRAVTVGEIRTNHPNAGTTGHNIPRHSAAQRKGKKMF